MASIDEARRKAEERKAELDELKAKQREKAKRGSQIDRTPVASLDASRAPNPFEAAAVDTHGDELKRQREMFAKRQQLPEVQNAGKPNAQDEKIRLFEAAKAKYLAKQVIVERRVPIL
jgi:hypothetical protein